MAQRIDGKMVSALIRDNIRQSVEEMKKETGIRPGLAVILVGEELGF